MRRYLRCPGAICCPAPRTLRMVLQPHIRFCDVPDRRRVELTAPRMRRLSPPAGCGGCSVGGKPGRCLRVRRPLPLCFSQRPQHRRRRRPPTWLTRILSDAWACRGFPSRTAPMWSAVCKAVRGATAEARQRRRVRPTCEKFTLPPQTLNSDSLSHVSAFTTAVAVCCSSWPRRGDAEGARGRLLPPS